MKQMITEAIVTAIQSYGILVNLREAKGPTDDLGRIVDSSIEVADDALEPTILPFTLCHLFGHVVQFALSNRYKPLNQALRAPFPIHLSEAFWEQYYLYEREAFGFGASLLRNVVQQGDPTWNRYSAFMEVDFAHFRHFVTTGEQHDRNRYREEIQRRYSDDLAERPIEPISIPAFKLTHVVGIDATIY